MANFADIAPALGRGLTAAQGQPGGYDAIDDRRQWAVGRQEGALTAGAYKVTQRSAGANMSVDVATDAGGFLVQGDDVLHQGLYLAAPTALKANLDIAAADPTNPRVDQIVLEARDDAHRGDGITRARVLVLPGTPTAGATLDNAAGTTSRAALPASTARLGEFVVAAGATSVLTTSIRDRRTWANGAYRIASKTTNATTASTSQVAVDTAAFGRRIECSGAPLQIKLIGRVDAPAADTVIQMSLNMDGVEIQRHANWVPTGGGSAVAGIILVTEFAPAAGSHVFDVLWSTSAGTATFQASATAPSALVIEEVIRPNSDNG